MPVFLLGFMGCGKSTLGRQLALALNFSFIDLDYRIEEKLGKSINQLFEDYGEMGFRQIEREVLSEICATEKNAVVALGGGTPCYFDNMQQVNHSGWSVYLKTSPQGLFNRLKLQKDHRPLLRNKNDHELLEFIEEKLEQREKFYDEARLTFSTESGTVQELKQLLEENGFGAGR